jgi:hypothetical protein
VLEYQLVAKELKHQRKELSKKLLGIGNLDNKKIYNQSKFILEGKYND